MKQLFAILLVSTAFMSGCGTKCIEDSGHHVSKNSIVKNFDEINVSGAIKLVLKQDSTYGIRIEADSNVITHVQAEVNSGELRIKLDDGQYCGTDSVVIYAGIGELKKLSTSGTVKVLNDGKINAGDLDITFSGTSDVSLNLSTGKLTTRIDGEGKLVLSGQAGVHDLTTTGTVQVNAFDFIAGVYKINVEGMGKANINVLNELSVKTSGSSEIYYKGNPKKVDEKKSGATKLEKVN